MTHTRGKYTTHSMVNNYETEGIKFSGLYSTHKGLNNSGLYNTKGVNMTDIRYRTLWHINRHTQRDYRRVWHPV